MRGPPSPDAPGSPPPWGLRDDSLLAPRGPRSLHSGPRVTPRARGQPDGRSPASVFTKRSPLALLSCQRSASDPARVCGLLTGATRPGVRISGGTWVSIWPPIQGQSGHQDTNIWTPGGGGRPLSRLPLMTFDDSSGSSDLSYFGV